TLTDRPTPPSYANYPEGRGLGETMPMWRVQTEGYTTHEGQLIGVVSRDDGFLDSPDTEWISGGVNSKGPNAVAIGRHGNFLHWGFAASPTFFTDEAKDVFENAVHYIARFDGASPIARKKQGTMMRTAIDRAIHSLSEAGYAETVARYEGYRADERARKAAIRAREKAGETLSEQDRRMLDVPLTAIPPRIDAASRLVSADTLESLDHDPERVAAHLASVRPYMRPSGWYELAPDPDLVRLGIANDDPRLLEAAVAMLKTADAALGNRLLARYTNACPGTPLQWKEWLETHHDRLFFTEAGGYLWLVDTTDGARAASSRPRPASSPGAGAPSPSASERASVQATARSPFAAGLSAKSLGDGRFEITLEVDVFRGWHAYDNVPASMAYRALTHQLDLPDGVTQVRPWKRPASHPSKEAKDLTVFDGRLLFVTEVQRAASAAPGIAIAATVGYQVCDDRSCLPPSTLSLTSTLAL
ncbi:MAG: protein-disulfide reductase DsbD domain-containing protein, partial [Planctomycetota bacterium]